MHPVSQASSTTSMYPFLQAGSRLHGPGGDIPPAEYEEAA
jgi:hypothetical protein